MDRENVIKGLECCVKESEWYKEPCRECPYGAKGGGCIDQLLADTIALLKEQEEEIENLKQTAQSMMEGICLLKEQESIKPTINEYGEAFCICGENVGIIPSSKNLPKILSKYCSECGRRMKWDECVK